MIGRWEGYLVKLKVISFPLPSWLVNDCGENFPNVQTLSGSLILLKIKVIEHISLVMTNISLFKKSIVVWWERDYQNGNVNPFMLV